MSADARAVATAYFEANDRLDPAAVAGLYAHDGEMVLNGVSERTGRDLIEAHYRRWMSMMQPGDIRTTLGPLIVDGEHVAVEILCVTKGVPQSMVDLITVREGKIARLACYLDPGVLPAATARGR